MDFMPIRKSREQINIVPVISKFETDPDIASQIHLTFLPPKKYASKSFADSFFRENPIPNKTMMYPDKISVSRLLIDHLPFCYENFLLLSGI